MNHINAVLDHKSKSGVSQKRLITKEKKLPVFRERGAGLTSSSLCLLSPAFFSCDRRSRWTGPRRQRARRKTQAVSSPRSFSCRRRREPRSKREAVSHRVDPSLQQCHCLCVTHRPTLPLSRSLPCICWRFKSWNYHWWHQSSFWSLWENIVRVLFLNKIDISAGLWFTGLHASTLILNNAECVFACRDCRVVKDMATGKSKGYGFVTFFNKWVRVPAFPHDCTAKKPCWALDVVMYYVVSIWLVTQTHFPRATRTQRMPSSRWADSGWEGGRSGPTGLRGNLSLNLQMKVCFTAL